MTQLPFASYFYITTAEDVPHQSVLPVSYSFAVGEDVPHPWLEMLDCAPWAHQAAQSLDLQKDHRIFTNCLEEKFQIRKIQQSHSAPPFQSRQSLEEARKEWLIDRLAGILLLHAEFSLHLGFWHFGEIFHQCSKLHSRYESAGHLRATCVWQGTGDVLKTMHDVCFSGFTDLNLVPSFVYPWMPELHACQTCRIRSDR